MSDVLSLRQQARLKLYPRDTQRICCSYSYFARYLAECVYDRFGIFDFVPYSFRLPSFTDADVIEASRQRAHEIGRSSISWSGGVDSSFLSALFISEGIPVTIVFNENALATSPDFYEVLRKESLGNPKVTLRSINGLEDFRTIDNLVTGDVVDTLLFPSPQGMQNHFEGGFKHSLVSRYGRAEGERLIGIIEEYGRKIGKPVATDDDVVRLFSWGCLYYPHREAFYHMIGGNELLVPFFDTQLFTDISYSSYWDSRLVTDNKKLFRDFITEKFGSDVGNKVPWQRSFYPRLVRNVRFDLQAENR